MRSKGELRTWNDDKGYGFIVPEGGGKDVFLHISAFRNRDRRPEVGQMVTYTLSTDQQGRPRASEATLPGDRPTQYGKQKGLLGAILISGGFLSLITWSVLEGKISAVVLWGYLGVSLLTYLIYAFDKTAAKDGAWRTKESTLHWFSLAGGTDRPAGSPPQIPQGALPYGVLDYGDHQLWCPGMDPYPGWLGDRAGLGCGRCWPIWRRA